MFDDSVYSMEHRSRLLQDRRSPSISSLRRVVAELSPHGNTPRHWAQSYKAWAFTAVPGVERSERHQGGGSLQMQWPLLPLGLWRAAGRRKCFYSRKQVPRYKAPVHLRVPGPCLAYQFPRVPKLKLQAGSCPDGVSPSRKGLAGQ